MPYHIGSIVCGEGHLGPAHPVRADVISCNGGRAAVLSSISIKAAVAGVMGGWLTLLAQHAYFLCEFL